MSTSSSSTDANRQAKVISVKESLISIDVGQIPLMKNEVGFIVLGDERLKAEVLRVEGNVADMQVFEDTGGVKVGDEVALSGRMLSVTLGPGLLGQVFDGLQAPLATLAKQNGFFLPRGAVVDSIDREKEWRFAPTCAVGAPLVAGQQFGSTQEGPFEHRLMVPFDEPRPVEVVWLADKGLYTVGQTVARIKRADGAEVELNMEQQWPVRRAIPQGMLRRRFGERLYPSEPMVTSQRIVDTFLPIALGGTACIPGPFGAGKTVLQNTIARHASVDICVIIACGERAGEVVETIKEYPELKDPRTGGSLMDRTIIICNTSSMPVAARESSIYTGITIAEYYRQMGYQVLCIADSTSRWAQAMRETSGRMEEIPGEEAFPAYLESSIKGVYERAGVIRSPDDHVGSVTLIGTVSPAGGNFEEPVTQGTLATVKCFLGLSSERAYKRYYPAIDPLLSWSRYLEQLRGWFESKNGEGWVSGVESMQALLVRGDSIQRMMQVAGEEGVSIQDFVTWQKSMLLDMVFLQQDAFDAVDAAMPMERQIQSYRLVADIVDAEFDFDDRDNARDFFTRITGLYKNWNYAAPNTPEFDRYLTEIRELANQHQVRA
ncbi:MAG: V-type ATP synthase subunit A [Myxococcota bacterium]